MLSQNKSTKWFTLTETIIVCSLFAVMVLGIILAINRAYIFLDDTRLSVRASNLAREWVEMIYNIRDSKWREFPSEKDKRWLYYWPSDSRSNTQLFWPWIYILEEWVRGGSVISNIEKLDSIDGLYTTEDEETFYSIDGFFSDSYGTGRERAKIMFTWTYNYLSWMEIATWNIEDMLWNWTTYYRLLRVYGIYKKNEDSALKPCSNSCLYDWTPAEMRFCVKTFYDALWKWNAIELCSIMTNFKE